VLLGLPALALAAAPGIAVIAAVSAVRGIGFAFTVVAGGAIIATLIPPERRGEGLGLYGVGAGLPSVLALPLGVWLAGRIGYAAALVRPAITFTVTAMAAGAAITFVPLALVRAPVVLAPAALLAQPAAATVARWLAGRHGDRHGPARLLLPGTAATVLGVLGVAICLAVCPVAIVAAMALFGAGFGAVQNSTQVLMYRRARPGGYAAVSAMWNVAYDGGLGLGGAGFGVLAAHGSYPVAFGLTATLMLVALLPAWRDRGPAAVRIDP